MTGRELGRRTIKRVRYYLLWDCQSCGTKGINSNTCKQCPQCGNPKEKNEPEYRSSTPVGKNYRHKGADVICQYCGSENMHRFSCWNCGAALDPKFEKQVKKFTHRTDAAWRNTKVQVEQTGFVPNATETPWDENDGFEQATHEDVTVSQPQTPRRATERSSALPEVLAARAYARLPRPKRWPWWVAATVLFLCIAIGGYVYQQYNSFTMVSATARSVSWTYSLPLEDFAARNKSYETESWTWRPPADAFNIRSQEVVVRYEPIYEEVWVSDTCSRTEDTSYNDTDGTWVSQVDVVTYDCSHYETKQVGEDPIHGTRWNWQEMEWAKTTPLTARGDGYEVQYPTFTPTPTLRRAGKPKTTFMVSFSYQAGEKARTSDRSYPRDIWESAEIGRSYEAIIDGFSNLRAVSGFDEDFQELRQRLP